MDKFFSNLAGGADKKKKSSNAKPRGNDESDSAWQGGRSGDMDSIKKKDSSSRLVGSGSGGGNKDGTAKNNNIFANAGAGINDFFNKNKPTKTTNSRGGHSLGGAKPGSVFHVSLDQPGPLGMEVEKRKGCQTTTIIAGTVPNGQADKAGLKRGDIVCHPQSNGEEEVHYDQFLAAAKSGRRPLRFDVRRIESSIVSGGDGRVGTNNTRGRVSADSFARKQAVIAAAEAREAKHKAKQKPIKKGHRLEKNPPSTYDHHRTEDSEETRQAVAAVKMSEQQDVVNLGYNPYESKALTGGQARTATVAMTQGVINAENAPSNMAGSGETPSPGNTHNPTDPVEATSPPPSPEFEQAFSIFVTASSDHAAVLKSIGIMRKVIHNAITKGQQGSDDTSSKFRRVRLSNPKIRAAISDMQGGLEVMMSTGFLLSENDEDGETYLVFPPGERGASWLGNALAMMESYENA